MTANKQHGYSLIKQLAALPESQRAKFVDIMNKYDPKDCSVIFFVSAKDLHERVTRANPSPIRVVRYTEYEKALSIINDLLEPLREMVESDENAIEEAAACGLTMPDEVLSTYHKARAAIARATGEQL